MSACVLHLLGPTGAGKSTILRRVMTLSGGTAASVEVGQMMRKKYPPEHFKGQAAPTHTQAEAWQMYIDGVEAALAEGRQLIIVDGQPRDIQQAKGIMDRNGKWGSKEAGRGVGSSPAADGAPRRAVSKHASAKAASTRIGVRTEFVLIDAPNEVRAERVMSRARKEAKDEGREPTAQEIEMATGRLNNDYRNCYIVLAELLRQHQPIRCIDTGDAKFHLDECARQLIEQYA